MPTGIKKRRLLSYSFLFSVIGFFLIPGFASAREAKLFFMSGSGVYQLGKAFDVRIAVNSGGKDGINAIESLIRYDPKYFSVKYSETSNIIKLWVKQPAIDPKKGTIAFAGGMPSKQSYKSTAGRIFDLRITPLKYGKSYFTLATSSVLTADGSASNILKEKWKGAYTIGTSKEVLSAKNFTKSLSGRILLQVQQNGEAWYIYPVDQRRYYLGRPADAFDIMRKLGLGTKHSYIETYRKRTFPTSVQGKILIDVEKDGEAWYINPGDKKGYYLGRPSDAFKIMREKGLGITDFDLDRIIDWAIER